MSAQEIEVMSIEEFLEWESKQETRHEFIDGVIFNMAGAAYEHNTIAVNVIIELGGKLRGSGCSLKNNDMGVLVGEQYVYPDITVLCGKPEFYKGKRGIITNPVLVIEILSTSTEIRDRGYKLYAYQQIPTMQAYLMLWQTKPIAELYVRRDDAPWQQFVFVGMETAIPLDCIHCELKLSEVYREIEFNTEEIDDTAS